MDQYVTGKIIKDLREKKGLTQSELADKLMISSQAISKWETGNGFPDVSILEDLAIALGISVSELFIGEYTTNSNTSFNMLKSGFYICPICGNIITSTGDAFVSCHGITLVKEEAIKKELKMEKVEDELCVYLDSPMNKQDYISFVGGMYCDGVVISKLYPEQSPSTRLKIRGLRKIYYYSKREGLFVSNVNSKSNN